MLTFEHFDGSLAEWERILDSFPDRQIFQTSAWLSFIAESQNAEPVIAVLKDGNKTVGYFAGAIVRKLGFRILGSSFRGWTTDCMGIRLVDNTLRRESLQALVRFAFGKLKCVHMELSDREFTLRDADGLGFEHDEVEGFEIDLTQNEDALFAKMTGACRRCIRKARKSGVVIEEARDEGFVDDYYTQLQDVFAKQSLVPTYSVKRVRLLVKHLLPTGRLLLLRARDDQGRCIATGVFPAMNTHMYFWGGASWRQHQILRPNEAIQWYAMRYWKKRGIQFYDMCGRGDYKRKYGAYEISYPWLRKSKYGCIASARNLAKKMFHFRQKILGRRKTTGQGQCPVE